jgi:hypothetical protein
MHEMQHLIAKHETDYYQRKKGDEYQIEKNRKSMLEKVSYMKVGKGKQSTTDVCEKF